MSSFERVTCPGYSRGVSGYIWNRRPRRPRSRRRTSMAHRTSHSYADDKEALLKRPSRMEGQVRGLRRMVQDDRYCLDIVQQINALSSAAREVALLVMEDHLRGCVETAIKEDKGEAAVTEMI